MADCILVGNNGNGSFSPYVDIFNFAGITAQNGVTVTTNEVINNVCNLSCVEVQAGFEGINIAMPNLRIGTSYIVNFDFQYTDAGWFVGSWVSGVAIFDTNYSDYQQTSNWTENLDRDSVKHSHSMSFTATATTMYLSFNVCALSDSRTNYFEITNLYVEAV